MKYGLVHRSHVDRLIPQGALRTALVALFAVGAVATASAQPAGFNLAWSDEFNEGVGNQPNSSVWGFDTGGGGWGNGELETYVTSQANCHIISDSGATDGQALQIEAQTDPSGNWYSARINTEGKKNVGPYGYVEYRAEMPNAGPGYWPACWMLGTNNGGPADWPSDGEIDIMEEIDGQNINHGSLHGPNNYNPTATITGSSYTSAYHTYGALWQPGYITFYVDGVAYESQTEAGASGWVFDNNPMFLLINLAIGGSFPGSPNGSTQDNGNLKVDYVRVYEQGNPGTPSGGYHSLTPQCATGSRLDLTNGSTANGNHLQIWAAGGSNQTWNVINYDGSSVALQSSLGNVCLDSGGATSPGSAATIWACSYNGNELWTATSDGGNVYTFMDANGGLCLDVAGAGSANGTEVDTYTCNGTNAQNWAVN